MINEYQTQDKLNPKLWTNEEFNPKLRLQLLKIAKAFYKFLGITAKIKDVTLTGSNANYNWTTYSDIDLHLIIDYKEVDENDTLVRELMQSKKSLWNNTYPIEFKNMNIELYAQNAVEPHTSTGVFSLLNNDWLQKPDPKIVSVDDNEINTKAKPYEFEIDNLDPYEDDLLYKIQNIKSRLKHLRQTGLETVGEYSIENLAFKSLRNSGHLEKLSDLEKDIMLTQLTPTLDEQWPSGPFGQEHDYANYGGPWGTGHHHKTDFKKGPGKTPTKGIGSDMDAEEDKDADETGYKTVNKENFADGKNPGRKGLSQRVGIPKNATIAQLEKASKSKGEKGRLARWQLNMRRRKKMILSKNTLSPIATYTNQTYDVDTLLLDTESVNLFDQNGYHLTRAEQSFLGPNGYRANRAYDMKTVCDMIGLFGTNETELILIIQTCLKEKDFLVLH